MKLGHAVLLTILALLFIEGCNRPATVDATVETNPTPRAKGVKLQATTAENVN